MFNFSPKIVTDGLVLALDAANTRSYISGSTVWRDLSPNGNSGTLTNGPTFSSDSNGVIQFDGADDYIRTNTSAPVYPFTISVWFSADSIHDGYILGYASSTNDAPQFGIVVGSSIFNNSKIVLLAENLTGQQTALSAINYNQNSYYNAVGVFESQSNRILYVNGKFQSTSTTTVAVNSSINRFSFGKFDRPNSPFLYFSGKISNSQIYNRALSAQEVLQNYNALKPRFNLT